MLTDLNIRNFAIIDRLHVEFGRGFNVLTGETGAGKSIIIDAVNLLLGGRARSELIRTGEEEASVEALFDLKGHPGLPQVLEEAGIEGADELLIRRTVSRSGKNRIFINGSLVTLGQLQTFAPRLVNIYGQHEHQSLQRPETHLSLLDHFGSLEGQLASYRELYGQYMELKNKLSHLDRAERERQQRLDLLTYQSREIAETKPREGEDAELEAERLVLQNAERLVAATQGGFDRLYGQEDAVCERLGEVASDLERLTGIAPKLGQLGEMVRSALYGLEDVATELRNYAGSLSFEPGRLDDVERRLAALNDLKRKYASTLDGVILYKEKIDLELEELSDVESTRAGLQRRLAETTEELERLGGELGTARRQSAQRLAGAMQTELKDLAMAKVQFEVRFTSSAEPGAEGLEKAEFFFSANPGEEPRPIARVASGGELSRLMLALRRNAPESDGVSTLVFDEVDAGIGGAAASAVGEKLKSVAGSCQVLCITHMPQVAAYGDLHFHVEKQQDHGRTFTVLRRLEGEERVAEMARMLGGARVTEATVEHAREVIAHASGATGH